MSHAPEKVTPTRDLMECAICGRHFAAERIKAHETICQKSSRIARKSFDISEQRIRGTEAERFAKATAKNEGLSNTQKNRPCGLSTNWRGKHQELLKKIKDAKMLANEKRQKISNLPFPPPTNYDADYVQCQHCLRQYNQISAARHIATCARRMCRPKSKTNLASTSAPTTSGVSLANE